MSPKQTMCGVMEESPYLPDTSLMLTVNELVEGEKNEVLAFLSERPLHTICMAGLINDNGLVSQHNRGSFYGCRNFEGKLEGVAMIGHATLIETRAPNAVRELARMAQIHTNTHMIMGEQERVEDFWNYYADEAQSMRLACRELLFELKTPPETNHRVEGLRLAVVEDLDLIAPVHAALAEAESGINPLKKDREGFLQRCRRRIEKNRVWVVIKDNQLIFKADIQADTPEVIYLEGIYVNPLHRGMGIGKGCLTQLCKELLERTRSICVIVNEENEIAQTFYKLCGFRSISRYSTLFLQK